MTKREAVKAVLDGRRPPYVPWQFGFTREAREALQAYIGSIELDEYLQNHFVWLGSEIGVFEQLDRDRVRDYFGVIWNRSVDKDIGIVEGQVLPDPTLRTYDFPDPAAPHLFGGMQERIDQYSDRFRLFAIGFSLFERAWTLRGMDSLMMDFYDHPDFVRDLLNAIADFNIWQVELAVQFDIDAVYFGDDWGQQHGLLMGAPLWREFIKPVLARMYGAVRDAGKYVMIHSCGDVDELFDDLVEIGFNPFQPEVMDTERLMRDYRGRLAFFGGLSTQRVLPYGSVSDVRAEAKRLLRLGAEGGYIFSPAHAVEGDVPAANMAAFIETAKMQQAFRS